jgi:group I intron endonuclease
VINSTEQISKTYKAALPAPSVGLELFRARIKACLKRDGLVDAMRIQDALYLSHVEYRKKYSQRRTIIDIGGDKIDIGCFFKGEAQSNKVAYRVFWQRVRRLKKDFLLDNESLYHAARLDEAEWISFYGGGRRRPFSYHGIEHPALRGKEFRSISSFLRRIERYKDKAIIWSRVKRGWDIDEALTEPVLALDERPGSVYIISCSLCEERYVGLTRTRIEQRWRTHLRAAIEVGIDTPLAKAIRRFGPENFTISAIEEGVEQAKLAERERYWISEMNTMEPNGFNVRPGGGMGGGQGRETTYQGETFPSMEVASQLLAERIGIPKHVVEKRLRDGQPIPEQARQMSDHPEAGTNLWRRWKALLNGAKAGRRNGDICERWKVYDDFATDVRSGYSEELLLVRINQAKPWCGDNVKWVTKQRAMEQVHGRTLTVEGKVYPSLNAVARKFGIGRTTLKNRIEVQGLSLEEAVRKELAPTSKSHRKQSIVIDGKEFQSVNSAAKFAAEHFQLTFDQARDRIRRDIPLHSGNR